MPDLEVPPDLSAESISDSMSVPEVDSKGIASYSTYQERIARRGGPTRDAGGEDARESPRDDASEESSEGSTDEAEASLPEEEDTADRDADETSADQEQASAPEPEPEAEIEAEPEPEPAPTSSGDEDAEAPAPQAASRLHEIANTNGLAQVVTVGQGKKYLRVTEGFSESWRLTGTALAEAGFKVSDEDRDRGVYFVDFEAAGVAQAGFWSSLAFWRGGGSEHELQLTGIGEKTEVVVLDEDGNWESSPAADEILSRLETALNRTGK
jgi:hypothetical protein